jgi:hypothetical protein
MHNLVPPKPPQPPQVNAAEFLALRTIVMGLVATILARAGPIDGRRRFRVSLQGWPLHVGCRPLFGNQRPLGPRNVHWPVGPRHLGQRAFAGDAAQCPLPAVVNWRADVRTGQTAGTSTRAIIIGSPFHQAIGYWYSTARPAPHRISASVSELINFATRASCGGVAHSMNLRF